MFQSILISTLLVSSSIVSGRSVRDSKHFNIVKRQGTLVQSNDPTDFGKCSVPEIKGALGLVNLSFILFPYITLCLSVTRVVKLIKILLELIFFRFDNRKEFSFEPVNQVDYAHSSAQNIGIITQFVCDTLVNNW